MLSGIGFGSHGDYAAFFHNRGVAALAVFNLGALEWGAAGRRFQSE